MAVTTEEINALSEDQRRYINDLGNNTVLIESEVVTLSGPDQDEANRVSDELDQLDLTELAALGGPLIFPKRLSL